MATFFGDDLFEVPCFFGEAMFPKSLNNQGMVNKIIENINNIKIQKMPPPKIPKNNFTQLLKRQFVK